MPSIHINIAPCTYGIYNAVSNTTAKAALLAMQRHQARLTHDRKRMRAFDIEESRHLLLELALSEPNIQHCFALIINACLTEDISIRVKGVEHNEHFKKFLIKHYHPFCRDAIKCIYIYGFIPWHVRKLASGDVVPSILPHGSFTWGVISIDRDARQRRLLQNSVHGHNGPQNTAQVVRQLTPVSSNERNRHKDNHKNTHSDIKARQPQDLKSKSSASAMPQTSEKWANLYIPENDNESKQIQHQIQVTHADLEAENIFIFDVVTPALNIQANSLLYATVESPLAHLLVDYRNLRDAQIRRSYADAWNTTARVFTSCMPPQSVGNEPTSSYLYYETGSDTSRLNMGRNYMQHRHRELEHQVMQPSNHTPCLYNLPVHHRLEQLSALSPCEDVNFLLEKFKKDVASVLGIPSEIAYGKNTGLGNGSNEAVDSHNRIFSNMVQQITHHLENLVLEVYSTIYDVPQTDIEVSFTPMPRLDIRSIDDLKTLFEMGAITPDVTAQLSEILLFSHKTNLTGRTRETTHNPEEYIANLRHITEATHPPKPDVTKPRPAKRKKS